MMDLRLRAYAPNGASQGLLPAPDSFSFAIPLNDTPSLSVAYATVGPRADILGQPLELAVEVSGDGGATWSEPDDCRFLYLRDGRDPIKTADTYTVEAPGYVWRLQKARVLDTGSSAVEGRRSFTGVTVGAILATLWNEAQTRGALEGMSLQGTAALDAAGVAWGQTISRDYDVGTDYLSVLRDMAESGLLDYRMTGRALKVYRPDTVLATDRTVGNSQVQLTPLSLTEAPFRRTWEGLADFLQVVGDEGAQVSMTNGAALKPWGRWEDFVTQGGVTDEGTLTALGQRYQDMTAAERAEFTQAIALGGDAPRPLVDFMAGDYIWSRDLEGTQTRYRVRQVTLQKDGNTVQGNVVLNDRFLEEDIRLQRSINALTGGASTSGSTGGNPTPPGSDILRPAAPGQPTATSAAYVAESGSIQAQIGLDWPDVTTNIDGTPITDLGGYEIWWRPGGGTWAVWTRVGADSSFLTMSPFTPDATYQFQVLAYDTAGNESPLSPTVTIVTATDSDPPSQPSAPTASADGGYMDVAWDGKNTAGNPLDDADLATVEIHVSNISGFTPLPNDPDTKVGEFQGPGRRSIPGLPADTRRYLRLLAVDTSGNSTPSVQVFVDGVTEPASSPVPTVVSGSGAAVVRWLSAPDATRYDLHVALDNLTAPGPTNLHTADAHSPMWVTSLTPGGPEIDPDAPVYVALVAGNAVGDAPASAWVEGTVGTINSDVLAASLAVIQSVVAELVETQGLTIGDQSWNNETGLTIPGVLNFPPSNADAANIWANLVARSLTVEDKLTVNGEDNSFSTGSKTKLASGVTDPKTAPNVAAWWRTVLTLAAPPGPSGQVGQALIEDPSVSGGWIVVYSGHGAHPNIVRYNAAGAVTQSAQPVLSATLTSTPVGAVMDASNSQIYVLTKDTSASPWKIHVLNGTTFALISSHTFAAADAAWTFDPAIWTHTTPVSYFCINGVTGSGASTVMTERRFNFSAPVTKIDQDTLANPTKYTMAAVTGLVPGTSGHRGLLTSGGTSLTVFNNTTNAYVSSLNFPTPYSSPSIWAISGWNYLNSARQIMQVRESVAHQEIAYSWRDINAGGSGEHETGLSPMVTTTTSLIPRGAAFEITPTPPPTAVGDDAPTVSTVYMKPIGSGSWRQQTPDATAASPSINVLVPLTSSTIHGTRPNFDTADVAPAEWFSEVEDALGPLWQFLGTGPGRTGPLSWDDDGNSLSPARGLAATAAQSIGSSVWTKLSLASDAAHPARGDIGASSSALQINKPGWYVAVAACYFSGGATGSRRFVAIGMETDPNAAVPGNLVAETGAASVANHRAIVAVPIYVPAAGYYLRAMAFQDSGGSINTNATGVYLRAALIV